MKSLHVMAGDTEVLARSDDSGFSRQYCENVVEALMNGWRPHWLDEVEENFPGDVRIELRPIFGQSKDASDETNMT